MAECLRPIYVKNRIFEIMRGAPSHIPVPCGKCASCRSNKQQNWAFRQWAESLNPSRLSMFFVTLTIDDEHLVINKHGYASIYKVTFQDFVDRLRYYLPEGHNFRYLACGDYGDSFDRPHYHFNAFLDVDISAEDFHDACVKAWKFCDPLQLVVEPFCVQTAEYVAKYCTKQPGIDYDSRYVNAPFLLGSRRPAIGKNWLETSQAKAHFISYKTLVYDSSGIPYNLPRYYRDKLWDERERKILSSINLKAREDMLEFKTFGKCISKDVVASRLTDVATQAEFTALKDAAYKRIQLDYYKECFGVPLPYRSITYKSAHIKSAPVPSIRPTSINEDFL